MADIAIEVHPTTVDDHAIASLLSLAIGGGHQRLRRAVEQYRDNPEAFLLAAVVDGNTVGVVGYSMTGSEANLLHIATAPHAQRAGVGTRLLAAIGKVIPAGLSIVAETDHDTLGFYTANNFTATPLGQKYPGVARFRVHLEPSARSQ